MVGDGGDSSDMLARGVGEGGRTEGVALRAPDEVGEAEPGDGRVEGEARGVEGREGTAQERAAVGRSVRAAATPAERRSPSAVM